MMGIEGNPALPVPLLRPRTSCDTALLPLFILLASFQDWMDVEL